MACTMLKVGCCRCTSSMRGKQILLGVSRENGNMFYRDYVEIHIPIPFQPASRNCEPVGSLATDKQSKLH